MKTRINKYQRNAWVIDAEIGNFLPDIPILRNRLVLFRKYKLTAGCDDLIIHGKRELRQVVGMDKVTLRWTI